jgi:hypothetical protein
MPDEFLYAVFLSHSSKDKVVVCPVAERLRLTPSQLSTLNPQPACTRTLPPERRIHAAVRCGMSPLPHECGVPAHGSPELGGNDTGCARHSYLPPLPAFQAPGADGCGTTSNLPRLRPSARAPAISAFFILLPGGLFG